MSPRLWSALLLALLLGLCPAALAASPSPPAKPPELTVNAPTPELTALVRSIVAEAGPRLRAWVGAGPRQIEVTVAGSQQEFNDLAASLEAPQWAAGLAVPERGLILVRSPRQLTRPEEFRLVLVHELTHLHLHAALHRREHPLWLEEGLAMYASGESSLERGALMAQAVLQKRLLPLAGLDKEFPADPDQAALAYAQSYYLVAYLIKEHGAQSLPRLVESLARGRDLTTALHEATGKGLVALNQDFVAEMESRFSWIALITAGGTLWTLASVVAALGLVRRRRAQRARVRAMDDADEARRHPLGRKWPPPAVRGDVLGSAGLGKGAVEEKEQEPPAPEGG